jgi:hypothetical protein
MTYIRLLYSILPREKKMNKVGGGRIYFDVSVIITQSADPVVTAKSKYPRIFFQLSAQEGCDALRISGREVQSISFPPPKVALTATASLFR